jgi:uncharacterized lipoprotein YehR (DUF1307 family)
MMKVVVVSVLALSLAACGDTWASALSRVAASARARAPWSGR